MSATHGSQQQHLSDNPATGPYCAPQPTFDTPSSLHGSAADQGRPPVTKLIRIKDVLERIPVSRSQLYNLIAAGKVPKPVHAFGGQSAFWVESEIEELIREQIAAERKAA